MTYILGNGNIALHVGLERDKHVLVVCNLLGQGDNGGTVVVRHFPAPRSEYWLSRIYYILLNCFVIFSMLAVTSTNNGEIKPTYPFPQSPKRSDTLAGEIGTGGSCKRSWQRSGRVA